MPPIECLQALEFHQVADSPQIPDSTTSRKRPLNPQLLVLTVPTEKRRRPIEATVSPTSVDPTTCNVKLQESKLRQGKLISWRGIGYGWRRSPNRAKSARNEARTEAQAATAETPAIVKIEIRIDQG